MIFFHLYKAFNKIRQIITKLLWLNLFIASLKRRDDKIIKNQSEIAVNKEKLYKLINVKKYDKAKSYLYDEQNNIYQLALNRLKPYIEEGIIYENEIDTFIQIIEKNIICNMLKDEGNIRMSALSIAEIIEKKKKLEKMKSLRRC